MKKIRSKDVAKQAGVSNSTVSRALNDKNLVNPQTYQRIVRAMNLLGYKASENIARYSTRITSRLIIIDLPTLSNAFYEEIIFGIEAIANRNNFTIMVNSTGYQTLMSICQEIKIGGVITLTGYSATQLDKLTELTLVVQCCEFAENYPLPYVSIDDYEATKKALNYLYTTGKRKFSLINQSADFKFSRERHRAFCDFLEEKNLELNENFYIRIPDFDYKLTVSAVKFMLSQENHPDSIFAVSDVFAAAAIKAASLLGINVPNELSVIGFDNLMIDEIISPSITSIQQPRFTLGSTACEFLIEKIAHPEIPNKQYLLDTELIIRESTLK